MFLRQYCHTVNLGAIQKLQFDPKTYSTRSYSVNNARRRVVVTGIGIVSPIGCTTETAWKGVLNGVCGIRKLEDSVYSSLPCKIAAKITENDLKLSEHLSKSEIKSVAPATAYALIAGNSVHFHRPFEHTN